MAVGAKLRYEVLRRDNYTCRFCGSSAPDVHLEIDHVIPRAHGGMDLAENLQALCDDCNAGKSMTMPERWLVREVKRASKNWRTGKDAEIPEDDYSEMFAYLDARFALEALPATDVVTAVMRVAADVYPYRPTGSELIIAAAKSLSEDQSSPAEVSC